MSKKLLLTLAMVLCFCLGLACSFLFSRNPASLSGIVEEIMPSVVRINAVSSYDEGNAVVSGTGMVFSEAESEYLIVTNAHVVDNTSAIYVFIGSYPALEATVIGKDNENDTAVLSIPKESAEKAGLESVSLIKLGQSVAVKPGDSVIAIGNGGGQGLSVTEGIISAVDRPAEYGNSKYRGFQTSADLSEGCSGGPLILTEGNKAGNKFEVIGMITSKLKTNADSLGYVLPSDTLIPVLEKIISR